MIIRPRFAAFFVVCVSFYHGGSPVEADERTDFPAAARQRYDEGRDLQKKGKLNEAIRAFEEAIKLGMEAFPRVHLQRAKSNMDLKEYDTAILQYSNFI